MNVTPTDTLTATDRQNLLAWVAEVNAVIAVVSKPIEPGDPKFAILEAEIGSSLTHGLTAELRGQMFASRCVELPPCPLPAPSWAVESVVNDNGYAELIVDYRGRRHGEAEGPWAQVSWSRCVVSLDHVAPDGESMVAGTLVPADPIVIDFEWDGEDSISWQEAEGLATVLASASAELRTIEEAGR